MGLRVPTDRNRYLVQELQCRKQINLAGTGLAIVPARMFQVLVLRARSMGPKGLGVLTLWLGKGYLELNLLLLVQTGPVTPLGKVSQVRNLMSHLKD